MKGFKPLGIKCYGSIPHLSSSRLGEGDHHCSEGQERISTKSLRDGEDLVIVQEKMDGCNAGVCKVNSEIHAIQRSGYVCLSSPHIQYHYFDKWVKDRESIFHAILKEGERIVGEWLLMAVGTKYNIEHPNDLFVPFDIMTDNERLPYFEFKKRVDNALLTPNTVSVGASCSVSDALKLIGKFGAFGATERVEGAIWRVEHKGKIDFLTKHVRQNKIDGKYFANEDHGHIWNYPIEDI